MMNRTMTCHRVAANAKPRAHQQVGQVAEHNHLRSSDNIAPFAYEWRGHDEGDIEQGIQQPGVLDGETDAVCTQ